MVTQEKLTTKICLVGDSSVGKTSLIRRYVFDEFDDRYISTLGTKVTKRELVVPFPELDVNVEVKLLIFDIIGEKGFRQLLKDAYFHGANGLMAVCDVTRGETLDSLDDWIDNAYEVTGRIPLHVLANKVDLKDAIVLSKNEINQVSKAFDSSYDFTSAKTGENVEKVFDIIARRIASRVIGHRFEDRV